MHAIFMFIVLLFSALLPLTIVADIGGGAVPVTVPPSRLPTDVPTSQPGFDRYTPASFPNSITDFTLCQMPGASLVCDPNRILTDGNITANHIMIDDAVDRIRETTHCACGAADGNLGECRGEGGFVISIALVDKMVLDTNEENKIDRMQAASTFANEVRNRQQRGQCDDDALIFLSKQDQVMWTSVGTVAQRYLTTELINAITLNAETFFVNGDLTKGLNYTISLYGQVLRGEQVDLTPPSGWYWPFPLWAVILIAVLLSLLAIACLAGAIYGCVKCCCQKDRHAEYEMGVRM